MEFPQNCPRCSKSLKDVPELLYQSERFTEQYADKTICIVKFQCSQESCRATVMHAFECWRDQGGERWSIAYFDDVFPERKYGTRTLNIKTKALWTNPEQTITFDMGSEIPKKIVEHIQNAMGSFSSGKILGAAAYARTTVLEILKHFNIPESETIDEKKRELAIHKRLDLLKAEVKGMDTYIDNLKTAAWIANDFLHTNRNWESDEVMAVLRNLYTVIDRIFVEEQRLKKHLEQFSKKRHQQPQKAALNDGGRR